MTGKPYLPVQEQEPLFLVFLLRNKSYHHIIKCSFLTFLRCHVTEGGKWAAV